MARSKSARLFPSFVFGFALASAIFAEARTAHAWCRTTTEEDFKPTPEQPCSVTGSPLFWSSRCVGFSVQRDASPEQGIDLTAARAIVKQAFEQWSSAVCPVDPVTCAEGDTTDLHPSIAVSDLGPVSCDGVEYNQKSGNANIIMFRDAGWPHADPELTLALTTVTFSPDSGEIYDADIEINSDPRNNRITTGDDKVAYDLASILTHETGHFLGMAHTQPGNMSSTMYTTYVFGATYMRDLSRDDTCGICAAYDPTRTTVCNPTPRRGLALSCFGGDALDVKKGGCNCALVGDDRGMGAVAIGLAGMALSIGIARRRLRRRRSRAGSFPTR